MRSRRIIMLWVCLLAGLVFGRTEAQALTGGGTSTNPYVISTAADLAAMHSHLDAYYVLNADLDLAGIRLTPVGNETEGAFTGHFNGQGHTLRRLTMELSEHKYVGVFGYLEGTVTNLKLENVTITGGRYVGAIAGNVGVGGRVSDCAVLSGTVTSPGAPISICIGGITGQCEGKVERCSNGADVSVRYDVLTYAGGLIGKAAEAQDLSHCTNSGNITAS